MGNKKKQKKKQASSSMASKAEGSSDITSGINSGDGVKSTESIEALTGINPKGKKRHLCLGILVTFEEQNPSET